jgi:hypothetical protein
MDAPAMLAAGMSNAAPAFRPQLTLGAQPSAAVLLLEITSRAEGSPTPPVNPTIEYLVIGGGGGGSSGGGGGGGFGAGNKTIALGTSYALAVGEGGLRGARADTNPGTAGGDSWFDDVVADGGAGAPINGNSGTSGASGSGGAANGGGTTTGGPGNTPATSPAQGNNGGGNNGFTGNPFPAGGGGGADAAGGNATSNTQAGVGGPGKSSSITGTATDYAGGGGGGVAASGFGGVGGVGGTGGGGDGEAGARGDDGVDNKGGGGGGGGSASGGGDGGDGVVILRYPNTLTISNPGGGLTYTTASVGSDTVATFTAGTGNVQWN